MELDLPAAAVHDHLGLTGESRAFVLLESARLRCESLMATCGRRGHLISIHREIGLAGFATCEQFGATERRQCVGLAVSRLVDDPMPRVEAAAIESPEIGRTLAKMFSETIAASDALAGELAARDVEDAHRDRLHGVHAHVMSACELLDERLTVLELQDADVWTC